MNETELMEQWAREAGALALKAFNNPESITKRRKGNYSIVTDVDEASERLLRSRIAEAFPADAIIGEEGGGETTPEGRAWVIDPIDGTGSFVAHLAHWCIAIGLVVDGHPVAGCVYLPVTDMCFLAGIDGPALLNGVPIEAAYSLEAMRDPEAWMAVPSNVHRRYRIKFAGKVRSLGSTAASICFVAAGHAVAGIVGRSNGWDIAGPQAILERAGGRLRLFDGEAINWEPLLCGKQTEQPLFAAADQTYAEIRQFVNRR